MTRKYFCDHCDKRIPSDLSHRKAHQQSVQHQQKKNKFYLQYQDFQEILLEEKSKRICFQWNQNRSCSFGENCKYSHRSDQDIYQMIQQWQSNPKSSFKFNVDRWIKKKVPNQTTIPESLAF